MIHNRKIMGLMVLVLGMAPLWAETISPPTGDLIMEDLDIIDDMYNGTTFLVRDNPPDQTVINVLSDDVRSLSMFLYDTSVANIYRGGYIGDILLYDSSSVYVGPAVMDFRKISGYGDSVATVYGGRFYYGFQLIDNAVLHLHGGQMNLFPLPVPVLLDGNSRLHLYGTNLTTIYDDQGGHWRVSGIFEDYTPFELRVYADDLSQVTLHTIPEPASVLLVAAGWAFLRKKR